MAERTATVSSLSKSHAMTGWRSGWVIGPTQLIDHVYNLALAMLYGLPGFIQEAALVAITKAHGEAGEMRDIYRRRRDLVVRGLAGINSISCKAPQGGMFMMIDTRHSGLSAYDFTWRLFRETGVAVLDASPFGDNAKGFLRMSIGNSDAELTEACHRIRRFAGGLA